MKKIVESWPIISIAILMISFLNYAFYYSQFGIPIHNYIDLSEIIFSLLTFVSSLFAICSFVLFIMIMPGNKADRNDDRQSPPEMFLRYRVSKYGFIRFFFAFFTEKIFYILGFIGLSVLIIYHSLTITDDELLVSTVWLDWYYAFLTILLSSLITLLSIRGSSISNISGRQSYIFLFAAVVCGSIFLVDRNRRAAQLIKQGKVKYTIIAKSNHGDIYRSNDTTLFIGSTRNYVFLYNPQKETAIVIPTNAIEELSIRQLRGGL